MNSTEALEFDIDLRIVDIWGNAQKLPEDVVALIAALLRASYGKGYTDALREPVRGQLCRDHGYIIPERQCS